MPPAWTTYVTVDDLKATVARSEPPAAPCAAALRRHGLRSDGGALRPGRRRDLPVAGAAGHIGCEVVNEGHGADTWAERPHPYLAAVADFYAAVLGVACWRRCRRGAAEERHGVHGRGRRTRTASPGRDSPCRRRACRASGSLVHPRRPRCRDRRRGRAPRRASVMMWSPRCRRSARSPRWPAPQGRDVSAVYVLRGGLAEATIRPTGAGTSGEFATSTRRRPHRCLILSLPGARSTSGRSSAVPRRRGPAGVTVLLTPPCGFEVTGGDVEGGLAHPEERRDDARAVPRDVPPNLLDVQPGAHAALKAPRRVHRRPRDRGAARGGGQLELDDSGRGGNGPALRRLPWSRGTGTWRRSTSLPSVPGPGLGPQASTIDASAWPKTKSASSRTRWGSSDESRASTWSRCRRPRRNRNASNACSCAARLGRLLRPPRRSAPGPPVSTCNGCSTSTERTSSFAGEAHLVGVMRSWGTDCMADVVLAGEHAPRKGWPGPAPARHPRPRSPG